MVGPDPAKMEWQQLERELSAMTIDQLDDWIAQHTEGYELPMLDLEVEEGTGPCAKPGVSYTIPAGQKEAIMYLVLQQVKKGHMKEVFYEHANMGCGFHQDLGNRRAETGQVRTFMRMYRILTDLRKLNAVLKKPPAHWVDSVPDARDPSAEVPVGSTYFLGCDISDAFSTCKLTERARRLCVCELNGRYFMYLGGPQGLVPMVIFWNCHIQDGFYRVMGNHWRKMWICFVDEMGVHGKSPQHVTDRARILNRILVALDKPHAFGENGADDNTCQATPQESMVLAGLKYSVNGISCNEEFLAPSAECRQGLLVLPLASSHCG